MICRPGFLAKVTTGESIVTLPASPGVESTSVLDENFQFVEPIAVFNYFDSYGYFPWYFVGMPGQPEREETVPSQELVRLCNVVDRFTLSRIEGTKATVPVARLDSGLIERMLDADNWVLAVETESGVETVNPTTMIWEDELGQRSKIYEPGNFDTLALEFLYATNQSRQVRSVSLVLQETADKSLKTIFTQSLLDSLIKSSAATLNEATDEFGYVTGVGSRSHYILQAISGLLQAYGLTGDVRLKVQALLLADALVRHFYPSDNKIGLPHARLSDTPIPLPGPVRSAAGEYGIVDIVVDFVDGIGILPPEIANNLLEVFQVYEGELGKKSAIAKRLFGKGYEIETFVDKDGIIQSSNRPVEPDILEPGKVVYLLGDDIRFIFPSYSAFVMGVY